MEKWKNNNKKKDGYFIHISPLKKYMKTFTILKDIGMWENTNFQQTINLSAHALCLIKAFGRAETRPEPEWD